MTTLFDAARFLKVPAASAVQYIERVNRGLPVRTLARIADAIAPADVEFRYRIIPKATLARFKLTRRLNKVQGELVTRLAEVWTDAIRVWKSDEAARNFLNRKHPLLENKRPIDIVLQSEIGAQLVRDVLGRLEHGSAV
ncbi:MAG: DUF2384 domain-containing protein [Rhodospirillales bacterium]|nr:DUF2384 domain-containing protein [Rhodospirillales bacterium]